MRADMNAPRMPAAAPTATITPTDADSLAGSCALCGQLMDPEPMAPVAGIALPVCWDCFVEITTCETTCDDTRKDGPAMLTPDTRRAIVTAATGAAVLTAAAYFTSGRRHHTLTQADRAILGDLGRRLAVRCALVQRLAEQAPRDHEHAAATFAAAFSSAYDAHLYDLSTGRQRDALQLAYDVLLVLAATSRAREGR